MTNIKTQYKVEYTHTHEQRKQKVKKFRHGWSDYKSTRKFLRSAKRNPRISNVRVFMKTITELNFDLDCDICDGDGWIRVETGVEYAGIRETMDEPCSCIECQIPKFNKDNLF